MAKSLFFLLLTSCLGLVLGHPADHREDTVLPFSLSPGNVNLETYYLDKYPKPGPGAAGGPQKKQPQAVDENMFLDNEKEDRHAIFRTRRAARPQYYPYHSGDMPQNYGHEKQQFNHQSNYGHHHERHHHYSRNHYPHSQYRMD